MSRWIEPFGFTKEESVLDPSGDLDAVILISALVLDLLTLPLALIRLVYN